MGGFKGFIVAVLSLYQIFWGARNHLPGCKCKYNCLTYHFSICYIFHLFFMCFYVLLYICFFFYTDTHISNKVLFSTF